MSTVRKIAAKKNKRDPNAPKRNLSAYLLYQNAMRDTFRSHNPNMTFGQLSKYTSAMYAELTETERKLWQERAESDKTRFLAEMVVYIPPLGYDAKGDMIRETNSQPVPGAIRKGKYTRDPNAPKKNFSAYLLYQNALRDSFKADNPGMTFGQLSKYTSHMYKSLIPEERAQWEERARLDKERYEEQMKHYRPPRGHDAQGRLIEDRPLSKKPKLVRDPNAPKRARGSFVFFTFDMRPQILKEDPKTKFTEIGTIMGQRWRALSAEEKKKYEDLAAEDKIRFDRETAAYKSMKEEEEVRNKEMEEEILAQNAALTASHHEMNFAHNQLPPIGVHPSAFDQFPSFDPNPNSQLYYDPTQYHFS